MHTGFRQRYANTYMFLSHRLVIGLQKCALRNGKTIAGAVWIVSFIY